MIQVKYQFERYNAENVKVQKIKSKWIVELNERKNLNLRFFIFFKKKLFKLDRKVLTYLR